ncbi:hypothetical protein Bca4012_062235 [Brassica carinata]
MDLKAERAPSSDLSSVHSLKLLGAYGNVQEKICDNMEQCRMEKEEEEMKKKAEEEERMRRKRARRRKMRKR